MEFIFIATCTEKHRDSQGKIIGYTIKFADGHTDYFHPEILRQNIYMKKLIIDNLRFDSKCRLIDKTIDEAEKEMILNQGQDIINLLLNSINKDIDKAEDKDRTIKIPVFYKSDKKLQPEDINKYISDYLITPIINLLQKLNYKLTTHNIQKVCEVLVYHVIGIMNNNKILMEYWRSFSIPTGEYGLQFFKKSALNN